ncbi:hypothetical protein [Limimaricola sp.]|uniref:hypothetical protein n=1 Tax=Limimaricola sp. TaxID=2211665 RepID=UPI004057D954
MTSVLRKRPLALAVCLLLPCSGVLADTALRAELFAAYAAPAFFDGHDPFLHDDATLELRRPVRAAAAPALGRADGPPRLAGSTAKARLLSLIAFAEAGGAGYDAVQHGTRHRPPRAPTRMTIGEILDWVAATPGQPHAIGRYQLIPATLRSLVRRSGVSLDTRFSSGTQDHLADFLLADAGLAQFERGTMGRRDFMNNLARIWAGLPASHGRSHYHGVAGNRAVISWASFERGISAIYR